MIINALPLLDRATKVGVSPSRCLGIPHGFMPVQAFPCFDLFLGDFARVQLEEAQDEATWGPLGKPFQITGFQSFGTRCRFPFIRANVLELQGLDACITVMLRL